MHVSVCDDNVADRKQMERLLNRESDKRAKITEGLYIDSYGNEKALLAKPMQYDIFYIDLCRTEGVNGAQIAMQLYDAGVRAPIYMCCSAIDYRQYSLPENVFFLDKPINADLLTNSLDHAYEVKKNAVPLIELRTDKETLFVTEEDIMYGIEKGKHVIIHLADGRIIQIPSNIENLYEHWEHYDTFLVPSMKVILNGRFIEKIGLFRFHMKDGSKFMIQEICKDYARKVMKKHLGKE